MVLPALFALGAWLASNVTVGGALSAAGTAASVALAVKQAQAANKQADAAKKQQLLVDKIASRRGINLSSSDTSPPSTEGKTPAQIRFMRRHKYLAMVNGRYKSPKGMNKKHQEYMMKLKKKAASGCGGCKKRVRF
jgi:hypothetical protein